MSKTVRRLITGLAAVAAVTTIACVSAPIAASASPEISFTEQWDQSPSDTGGSFQYGSPGVATLDSDGLSVVIGNSAGKVYAYHLSDGSLVDGWPYLADAAIFSTPATIGSKSTARMFFGVGSSADARKGGLLALNSSGNRVWSATTRSELTPGSHNVGTMASVAVGPLQSSDDVIAGAMGQMQLEVSAATGKTRGGFPWLEADTNFSSPAIANIRGGKTNYIIEGGDSTAGRALFQMYTNGGHIRILHPTGYQGSTNANDGLLCQYNTNQVVQSAPAVGPILTRGGMGVVTGTNTFYGGASDTNKLIAINSSCKKVWSVSLDGVSWPSPALADLDGSGKLDVVTQSENGTVYALNGATGHQIWKDVDGGSGWGSITTFKSPTGNFQYVLVPTDGGVDVLDGRDGAYVTTLGGIGRDRNSATVTADPDGAIGITIAGGDEVVHYTVDGTSGYTTVQTPGAWPMYHHDPQLTGFTGGTSTGNVSTKPTKPCATTGVTKAPGCIG